MTLAQFELLAQAHARANRTGKHGRQAERGSVADLVHFAGMQR